MKTRYLFACALLLILIPVVYAAPAVTTDRSSYNPGDTVIISGSGFAPGASVIIEVLSPTGRRVWLDQVQANSQGGFTSTFTLPGDAETGTYTVYASAPGESAQRTFSVSAPTPPPPSPPPSPPTYITPNLTIALSSYEVNFGRSITAYGWISPALSTSIAIMTSTDGSQWETALTTTTNSTGHYSTQWYPTRPGTFYLRAQFYGMGTYLACLSNSVSLRVLKIESAISLRPQSQSLTLGGRASFEGELLPRVQTDIAVQVSTDRSTWTPLMTVATDSQGRFSFGWEPTVLGSFFVRAYWAGDELHEGASSPVCEVEVVRQIVLSISLDRRNMTVLDRVNILGSTSPAQTGRVLLELSSDGVTWFRISEVNIGVDGSFSYLYAPAASGSFYLRARFGDLVSNVERLDVRKVSTSMIISVSPQEVTLGGTVRLAGAMTPAVEGIVIEVTFTGPGGSAQTRRAATGADGSFVVDFAPGEVGSWSAVASWAGDDRYSASTSNIVSFGVSPVPTDIFRYLGMLLLPVCVLLLILLIIAWRRRGRPAPPQESTVVVQPPPS
jgi:hypothetical protein